MLTWHYVTSTEYNAASAETKTADKLYFLSDTKQIYRGTELFTEACSVVTEYPATPAVGRLYILSTTLEGKIWNGTAWQVVIQPVQATVDASDTAKPVSGKAVADYVTGAIADVTGDASGAVKSATYGAGQKLTFTKNDSTTFEVEITDLPVDLAYDSTTGLLQLKDNDGAVVGTGINLDLERFVQSGSYDPETKKITLVFNDSADPVEIDASALVDVYTGEASTSATVTVSADNKIKAEVKLAEKADNTLKVHEDGGLYVAPTDLSALATTASVEEIKTALETAISDEQTRAEAAEEALSKRIQINDEATASVQGDVDKLTAKVGTVPTGKTVVGMIEEAQQAATYDDTALAARVKANEDALAVVQGDADGSINKALADAKAYTDEKDTAMDARVDALEADTHTHANKAELDKIADGDKAKWDQAVADLATETSTARAAEKANADAIDVIEAVLEWKTTV